VYLCAHYDERHAEALAPLVDAARDETFDGFDQSAPVPTL
jgi:hypothetical protein